MPRSHKEPLPWKAHGWSRREAAVHLLDRFGFGASRAGIDRLLEVGFERWFNRQLKGRARRPDLDRQLESLDLLKLPIREFGELLPQPSAILQELKDAGILSKDFDPQRATPAERDRVRPRVTEYMRAHGYRTREEYLEQIVANKILRAVYSPNLLHEVLADFWFNHFNVTTLDNQCRPYVLAYERDAIRPHVAGSFRRLLGATARHPAMLRYLDNASSSAAADRNTTLAIQMAKSSRRKRDPAGQEELLESIRARRMTSDNPPGLNENYARELLELHTLGVDGGYDQEDVVNVARAFTGWSVYPHREILESSTDPFQRGIEGGWIKVEDAFVFRADSHDAEAKRVLGRDLPPGRGVEDGEDILDLLAQHPSTARFIAHKLAVRFVNDKPASSLIDRLSTKFIATDGEIAEVLQELVRTPEFWQREHRRQKIKSPFEFAISALRSVRAEIEDTKEIAQWLERMGQPLYEFAPPTGYPDRADFWVSAGALLNRMNFGLTLGGDDMRGVSVDLLRLIQYREPESRAAALRIYSRVLLPQRSFDTDTLRPLTEEPQLHQRVRESAERLDPQRSSSDPVDAFLFDTPAPRPPSQSHRIDRRALHQVVGVLLGSPEFQRK